MILDVLISRYLDGELTPEEDAELRSLIAADIEAKEAFDAAILLHIAMRCEDDTVVPDDVREDTLAALDVRMAALPVRTSRTRSYRAMAALAVTFLVLCLPFGDTYRNLGRDSWNEVAQQTEQNSTIRQRERESGSGGPRLQPHGSEHVSSTSFTTTTDASSDMASDFVNVVTDDVLPLHPRELEHVDETIPAVPVETSTVSVHSLFASADEAPFTPSEVPQPPVPTTIETRSLAASHIMQQKPVDVLVTTSYGQSMTGTVSTEGAVTMVSAGVGFSMAKNTFMGLELGTMSYATIREHQIMTRAGTSGTSSAPPPILSSDHVSKLPPTVMPGGTYTTTVYSHAESEGAAWGAAFLQQRIFELGPAHINGRVAAGVTEDGVLGYGRLGTDIRLFDGVSATVGADASYAPIRQFRHGKVSAQTYGLFLSLTYGIQVRL